MPEEKIERCDDCGNVRATGEFVRPYCHYCVGELELERLSWRWRLAYRILPHQGKAWLLFFLGLSTPWMTEENIKERVEQLIRIPFVLRQESD